MSDKDTIRALDVREQCRMRLPVWFGSRDNYTHGVREILANASDEISNNFDEGAIVVTLEEDKETISIFDTGRGIPINGETNGVKNYELLFLTLFSGTNYDNVDNGKITTGANGVGTCVLNHTSELFEVSSIRNYKKDTVIFKDGGYLIDSEFDIPTDIPNGTFIRFKLDKEVYTNTIYNTDDIKAMLKALSGVNSKLVIKYRHLDEKLEYHYDSINDYLEDNSINKIVNTYSFNSKEYDAENELNTISCTWNVSTEPFQNTFLNYTNLIEQGSIYDGFIDGMRKVFTKASKSKFTNLDIEMSFGFVVSVLSTNVEFTNQTKFSTNKQLYKKLVSEYIVENMEIFKAEKPQEFDKILKHLQQINTFNTKNENSIKNIKKKLSEKTDTFINRVETLVDCREHGENAELFITEGKSALSSVVASRNSDFQAAMPVRGKTLSVLKASADQIFNNQIILDIIKVLGCGCSFKNGKKKLLDDFNIDNLRYGKIILTVDRDSDGASIACLLATTFYKLMPELLKQGKIYLAKTPLYEITTKDDRLIYAFSDKEKDVIVKENKIAKIQRNKGLGEMSAEVMAETTMNPETRVIEKIVINNEKDMKYYFEKWMGNDVSLRKEHIENHLHEYMSDLD